MSVCILLVFPKNQLPSLNGQGVRKKKYRNFHYFPLQKNFSTKIITQNLFEKIKIMIEKN